MNSHPSQTLTTRFRASAPLVGIWLVIAAFALWSLRPVAPAYAPPADWTHVAPGLQVQDILIDGRRVWLAGIGGLIAVDAAGREQPVTVAGADSALMLRAIARDSAGQIWVAHRNGLSRLTADGTRTEPGPAALRSPIRALAVDSTGRLWAGGETGLYLIAADGTVSPVPLPVAAGEVSALLGDTRDGLWVGTVEHGLMRMQGDDWAAWTAATGLPHPQVTSLMQDRNGAVWAGTGFYSKGGAVRFEPGPDGWRIGEVLTGAELAGAKVRTVFEDGAGRMWFGHEYDGLTIRRNGRTVATLGSQDGLPDPEVTVIRDDGAGGLWIGTLKGAVHLPEAAMRKLFSETPGENDDA